MTGRMAVTVSAVENLPVSRAAAVLDAVTARVVAAIDIPLRRMPVRVAVIAV